MEEPMANPTTKSGLLCELRYQLTQSQAEAAFRLILDKRGPKARLGMTAVLLALGIGLGVWYFRDPLGVWRGMLAVLCVVLGTLINVYPALRARRSAKQITRRGGWYQLKIYQDGSIVLPDGTTVSLHGDRGSRGFRSPQVIALRPDSLYTFCIPVDAVPQNQLEPLCQLLERSVRNFQNVT
jgi:hypothetical protein